MSFPYSYNVLKWDTFSVGMPPLQFHQRQVLSLFDNKVLGSLELDYQIDTW